MSNPGEVFRFVSNWTTRSTGCAGPRQFLWVLALRPYSPGGPLNALAYATTHQKCELLEFQILQMSNFKLICLFGYLHIYHSHPWWVIASGHRLRPGLHRYLICFAPLAFVPQRQENSRCLPSPLVFQLISTHFTATLTVPAPLTILNLNSIASTSEVKPRSLRHDLKRRLRTLYAQWIRITLAPYVLPRLLARS